MTTTLRPDLVHWPNTLQFVCFVELTVYWEDGTEEANEQKRLRYVEMASNAHEQGWNVLVHSVEVGSWGFVATSTIKLLKNSGVYDQILRQTIRGVADAA